MPYAGPPHVMAGMMLVLISTRALRFFDVSQAVRSARSVAELSRFTAWVATRCLPLPTGVVPRSATGALASTLMPALASWSVASFAALG